MNDLISQTLRVLSLGGIMLAVFIILLLNGRGVKKSGANKFLSILLAALAFSIAHIFFAGKILNHLSRQLYSIGDPSFYLIAPLLWLYVRELTGDHIRWRWQLLLNFLPFIFIVVLSLSFPLLGSSVILFLDENHYLITIAFWVTLVAQ